MKPVRLAIAACVFGALVTGCDAGVMSSASATGVAPVAAPSRMIAPPVAIADRPAKFGERRSAGESLMVTVLAPKSFVPGETAYPRAPRAAAFEVAVENQGTRSYRPTQLVVRATDPDGNAVVPVVDKAQGYAGNVSADIDVPPGKSIRLTFAFAVPVEETDLRVIVQPDIATASDRAEFGGTV
ncbi:hypothetical protein LWC34_27630 [Kibdelosporangium philippinense]|uniref:DUF4352 domain-containing protein n=1 Tax=Kibdelosporangium philippinense TaxID=211113 RepID=A0ABS8ZJC0_9PSEU|nr:hypothetical protein [Kibdelosporangium philippinense]MCE7006573.1 hypothetical protein [Kibdelosporangium philippinense]